MSISHEKCDKCGHHAVRHRTCKVCADAADITYGQMEEVKDQEISSLQARINCLEQALKDIGTFDRTDHSGVAIHYLGLVREIAVKALLLGEGEEMSWNTQI